MKAEEDNKVEEGAGRETSNAPDTTNAAPTAATDAAPGTA